MAYDIVKFKRGQVWMITSKSSDVNGGHEQAKNRPWLVLSIGKFNQSSGMVTAVPITSRDYTATPAHVRFKNLKGEFNVVMCEQIKTFDCNSDNYFFMYMGELSDEIMALVDKALTIHLGINHTPTPTTIERLYEVVDRYASNLSTKDAPAFTDDDVIRFAEKLDSLLGPTNPEIHKMEDKEVIDFTTKLGETIKEKSTEHEDIVVETPKETPTIKEEDIEKPKKPTRSYNRRSPNRRVWDKENCEKFLYDIDNLPMKEVIEKWGFENKSSVYKMKYYVQNLLKNL